MAEGASPLVLHVPFTWFPDPCGGTEVYVRGLAAGLARQGFAQAVAAPAAVAEDCELDGLRAHRFATDPASGFARAFGEPDEVAARGFAAIVERLRPAIVHLHARTPAVSHLLPGIAKRAGAKVVFTYHTPTASCPRGTMMLFGETPCDGEQRARRCAACVLVKLGLPRPLARCAAVTPAALGSFVADALGRVAPAARALAIPGLVAAGHRNFRRLAADADHVVAVCGWVREVLLRNGVPEAKITLSRQGVARAAAPLPAKPRGEGPLRLAAFGRVDPTKGLDLVAGALAALPDTSVAFDVFAIRGEGGNPAIDALEARARVDRRLRVLPAVGPDEVIGRMADYDMIAIPSRWLETGPLVALEAFAAGVPVLGARLGGVAELVRDGVDGILVAPDDPSAWMATIARLSADPATIARLRAGVAQPRSMDDCVADMAAIYSTLLSGPGPVNASGN